MSIRQRLRALVAEEAEKVRVDDVRIGLSYTAVKLDDGRLGVSYSFGNRIVGGCSVFRGARPLAGRQAFQLLDYILSDIPVECSVGLATVNAIVNILPTAAIQGDMLDAVELTSNDHVGMVGYFGPLVPAIERRVAKLDIFEETDRYCGVCRPAPEALDTLPQCDVALITSTAIVNGTIDDILRVTRNCRETVLLGSSTPLSCSAFEGTSVTWLSGIVVHHPAGILRIVSEGGGTVLFKSYVTKININCAKESHYVSFKKNTDHCIS